MGTGAMGGFGGTAGILVVALIGCGCTTPAPVLIDSYDWRTPVFGMRHASTAVVRMGGVPLEMCASRPTPWGAGGSCGPDAVLQPGFGRCAVYDDATPRRDAVSGHYRADRDRGNWIDPSEGGVLEVLQVYVADNGEGEDLPHGPHGNLYWDVFGAFEPLMESADGAPRRRLSRARVLRGPHRTHGDNDEWIDDEAMSYVGAGLHRWGSRPGTEDAIVLRVWESDGSEDGFLGRRNDVLGMEHVRRADTERPCGVWVPFHRYRNSHPRKRTSEVMLWMWLRTVPAPAPEGRWVERRPSGVGEEASPRDGLSRGRDSATESATTGRRWIPPTEAR